MTPDELYDQWLAQRRLSEPSPDFAQRVVAEALRQDGRSRIVATARLQRPLRWAGWAVLQSRPVQWTLCGAAAAVCALRVLGAVFVFLARAKGLG